MFCFWLCLNYPSFSRHIISLYLSLLTYRTKELIGVAAMEVDANDIRERLLQLKAGLSCSSNSHQRHQDHANEDCDEEQEHFVVVEYESGLILADTTDMSTSDIKRKKNTFVTSPIEEGGLITNETFYKLREAYYASLEEQLTEEDFKGRRKGPPQYGQSTFSNLVSLPDGRLAAAYPLPLTAEKGNLTSSTTPPPLLMIHISPPHLMKSAVVRLEHLVRSDLYALLFLAVACGILGVFVITLVAWHESKRITTPLELMDHVSRSMMTLEEDKDSNTKSLDVHERLDDYTHQRHWPRTELVTLLQEFKSLITSGGFSSGSSHTAAAKEVRMPYPEVRNCFQWYPELERLYDRERQLVIGGDGSSSAPTAISDQGSVKQKKFRSSHLLHFGRRHGFDNKSISFSDSTGSGPHGSVAGGGNRTETTTPSFVQPNLERRHKGTTLARKRRTLEAEHSTDQIIAQYAEDKTRTRIVSSSLFWWILILIVLPLVLTNLTISWIVSCRITQTIPGWIDDFLKETVVSERATVDVTAFAKASVVSSMVEEGLRDLHVLTRMANWLLFGAVNRSTHFPEMITLMNECKLYPPGPSCPYYQSDRYVCPCEWNDQSVATNLHQCRESQTAASVRPFQKLMWGCERQDTDPVTGARNATSSFLTGYAQSPNSTLWWHHADELPGSWKGANASGYETTYDRLRVSAPMSVVAIPLYNYRRGANEKNIGVIWSFDADGLVLGYDGCDLGSGLGLWSSNKENLAAENNEALCPLGKFGYDARCRGWYVGGKKAYLQDGSTFYLSSPYQFADVTIGTTATAPIANPATGEYLGQIMYDLSYKRLRETFNSTLSLSFGSSSFLVHTHLDNKGNDSLFVTFHSVPPVSIAAFLFQRDMEAKKKFEDTTLLDLKLGGEGVVDIDGWVGMEGNRTFAYYPVRARTQFAVDTSKIDSPLKTQVTHLFSVAITSNSNAVRLKYRTAEDDLLKMTKVLRYSYLSFVALLTLAFVVYACLVSVRTIVQTHFFCQSTYTCSFVPPLVNCLDCTSSASTSSRCTCDQRGSSRW